MIRKAHLALQADEVFRRGGPGGQGHVVDGFPGLRRPEGEAVDVAEEVREGVPLGGELLHLA